MIISCIIVGAQITNITIKVEYVHLHSVERDPDNSIKAEKKNTDQSPPHRIDSLVDMITGCSNDTSGNGGNSGGLQRVTVDAEPLVAQTQDRMLRALKRRYQYDSNLKPAQALSLIT